MTRAERAINLVAVVVPFLAFAAAVVLLWEELVGPSDVAILVVTYLLTGFGITVGFHRLLTHRSFRTHPWIERVFAVLGSMAVQGPVITWVADHRRHHAHTDEAGDPHSPHVRGDGSIGGLRGLWHAHVGWMFRGADRAEQRRYARELVEDPAMRRIDRGFPVWVAVSLAVPFAAGLALTGSLVGGVTGLLWGGGVRIFLLHHVTWSINSVCHFFGRRRFRTADRSTNVFWLSLASFGESWHHNHHAFPRSARHGLRWWELDTGGLLIGAMERLGLAWDVVRIAPERQRARLEAAGPGRL